MCGFLDRIYWIRQDFGRLESWVDCVFLDRLSCLSRVEFDLLTIEGWILCEVVAVEQEVVLRCGEIENGSFSLCEGEECTSLLLFRFF